jgi:hypothetical protein
MVNTLSELSPLGHRICIISPFTPLLTSKILNHWDIPFNSVVSNSDQSNDIDLIKSLKKANAKIGLPSSHIVVFCSTPSEIQTTNALGNISVHCGWTNQQEEIRIDATMKISKWSELSAITALFQQPSD